jgi:peptidase A4-like protein
MKNLLNAPAHQASTSLVALTLAVLSLPAYAQVRPPDTTGQTPGSTAVFYAAPPADFDPLNALPSELDQYGIPPRPNPSDAVPFANWKKLVTSPQTRLTNLTVKATNVFHGPVKNAKMQGLVGNTTATTSNNWSAYAVTDTKGTFSGNGSFVYANWTIPAAGVDNCNYTPYMSSQWVGFDGAFFSDDVLQAGTEVDGCPGHYYAWYEWYTADCTVNSASQPCYSFSLNLPINPGDLMAGEVWYTTTAPHGHAYLYNYTTQQSASVAFNQPSTSYSGAVYQGNTVEWVVERPNGGAPNLTNYVGDGFNVAYAYNGGSYFYPGSSPAGSTTYNISMTCPAWIPSSSCPSTTDISVVDLYGIDTLWFYTRGPAYQ